MDLSPLIDALSARRAGDSGVRSWSLHAIESRRVSLGIKDREAGNPQAPLGVSEAFSVAYKVVWRDDLVSRGAFERRQAVETPREALVFARAGAYDDADAARVAGPSPIPEVTLRDDRTARVATGDVEMLGPRLEAVRASVGQHGFRTWSGSFGAAASDARVVTSAGLDVAFTGTRASWHVTFDGEHGAGFAGRAFDDANDFRARLDRLTEWSLRLRREAPPPEPGLRPVVLHPDVVEEYVIATLIENLSGAAVAHGESAFRRDQFGSGATILREDLTLRIDPLQDLAAGSYRCSGEGVPAARAAYIDRGRLVTPVLDLKYASRLGLAATPVPYAMDVLHLEGPPTLDLDEALALADGGAVVLNVLGVHTQDAGSGDFSLAAPQCVTVRDGRTAGRLRATLSGNLFAVLRADDSRLVRFPGEHTPGLLAHCRLNPR